MFNLLNESFSRLKKDLTFKVCLIIVLAIPVLIISMEKILLNIFNENPSGFNAANKCLFMMTGMLPLFIAIAAGFFIASDFKQNTVRNKIICGYSRTSIYMANWITSVCITLIYHIASTIVSMAVGSILFEPGEIFTKVNIYYSLVCIPVLISFTSITVTMTMMLKNAAGAIFSYFIHEIFGLFNIVIILLNNEVLKKFLCYFLPSNQLNMIVSRNYLAADLSIDDTEEIMSVARYAIPKGFDAAALPIYAIILIAAVTALGIWHFNKKDVK